MTSLTPETDIDRLKEALRRIATLQPTRRKKASMRGLVVQLQALAVSALGEDITLGIDDYDAGRPVADGPFTGERGNLSLRSFR